MGRTTYFDVRANGSSPFLYLDTMILVNFANIGRLDLLLLSGRTVVITEEVFREAVTDARLTGKPNAIANANIIDDWIIANESKGTLQYWSASDDQRLLLYGDHAGELSIAASLTSPRNIAGNAIMLSDETGVAFDQYSGSTLPNLTGQYYLVSLVLGGDLPPFFGPPVI